MAATCDQAVPIFDTSAEQKGHMLAGIPHVPDTMLAGSMSRCSRSPVIITFLPGLTCAARDAKRYAPLI
jgi:hypothetical protein